TYDLFEGSHENLAVADLARARGVFNGFHGAVDQIVGQRDLDLYLGQEVDDILGAAIELGMPLLAAETLDFGNRDPLHADPGEGLANLVKLEGLDDCSDELHGVLFLSGNEMA